jgi:hypothetical protein
MKKKLLQLLLKICGFILLANLPFLTITHLIGTDTFIESFKNPHHFYYIKNENIPNIDPTIRYIILEKPHNQASDIKAGDSILCQTVKNTLQQRTVSQIRTEQGTTTFYTISSTETTNTPIHASQIAGKIIGTSENNIWYLLSLQIWDVAITKLNILALQP